MPPLQRRTLATCIFALAFILFYEARGQRFVSGERETQASAQLAKDTYWEQTSLGIFVVVMGSLLIATLRRPGHNPVYSFVELAVYAFGIGVLMGTAYSSWIVVAGLQNGT
jgi:hypothetical protein